MTKFLFFVVSVLFYASAYGQAMLTFAGGSGKSLSIRLDTPVSYLVTGSSQGDTPIFNFQGVGDLFANKPARVAGSISFSIDGGAPLSIQFLSSGYIGGDVRAVDLFAIGPFLGASSSVHPGQIVSLLSGTSFTLTSFSAVAPMSGSYPTFLSAGQGTAISGFGSSVPEPRTWAGFAAISSLFLLASRVRRATMSCAEHSVRRRKRKVVTVPPLYRPSKL